jgi:hypothetical protein
MDRQPGWQHTSECLRIQPQAAFSSLGAAVRQNPISVSSLYHAVVPIRNCGTKNSARISKLLRNQELVCTLLQSAYGRFCRI